MAARDADPKLAMHVVNRGAAFGEPPQGAKPGIAVLMFDANGEAHGRSDDGFGLMYKVPDCTELQAGEMSVLQVNALAESYRDWQGNNQFWLCAPLLSEVDDETVVRAWKWWEDSINLHQDFEVGSTVILEFMQEVCMFPCLPMRILLMLNRLQWALPAAETKLHGRITNAAMSCNLDLVADLVVTQNAYVRWR